MTPRSWNWGKSTMLRRMRICGCEALIAFFALPMLTSCKEVGQVLSQLPLVVPEAPT